MNGPRSSDPYSGSSESTLDALNRTITDLENKILGQSPHAPVHHSAQVHDSASSLADQIRLRQRSLAQGRSGRQSRRVQHGAAQAHNKAHPQNSAPIQRAPTSKNNQLDLATVLNQLRHELKNDVASTVRHEVAHLRGEMQQVASDPSVPVSVGHDLEQIAQSLKQLETSGLSHPSSINDQGLDSLRLEVDSLRSLVDTLAKEDSLLGLDRRWSDIEETIRGFDQGAIQGELNDLAVRLDDIRTIVSQMDNNSAALQPLEHKIETISLAIAELMDRPAASFDSQQMSALTAQTEDRLAQLFDRVEQLASQNQNSGQPELVNHIESLSARLGNIATQDTILGLEERIANLQSSMGANLGTGMDNHMPLINERLEELSTKVDALDQRSSPIETSGVERLVGQLTEIAHRLDEKAQPVEVQGIDRLEEKLANLTDRLDVDTQPAAGPNVDGLQSQIEQLSQLINNNNVSDVSNKLEDLHEHLNTNDDYVFEAAKQAAEATLAAYQGQADQASGSAPENVGIVNELAGDVKELEKLYRASNDRSEQAMNAVHNTLHQISDRLAKMEVSARATESVQPAPVGTSSRSAPNREFAQEPMVNAAAETEELATVPSLIMPEGPEANSTDLDAGAERASNSLLSNLAGRMKRKGSQAKTEPEMAQDHETPALSPLQELEGEFADEPLEPGSGAPDISKIMEKVRQVQKTSLDTPDLAAETRSPADTIASARRAALAAAAEVGSIVPDEQEIEAEGGSGKKPLVRKPVIIAACAILVAILSFPIVKQLSIFNGPEPTLVTSATGTQERNTTVESPQATINQIPVLEAPEVEAAQKFIENAPRIVDAGTDQNAPTLPVGPQLTNNNSAPELIQDVQNPEITNTSVATAPQTAAPAIATASENEGSELASTADVQSSIYASAVDKLPDNLAPLPLKQAAAGGDPIALYEVGVRYAEGKGTQVSSEKAIEWLRFAADQNFAPAQYRLGNMYEKGTGIARDLEKARNFYQSAALSGNVSAMHNLGVLYASGGTAEDLTKAASWFKQAAEYGVRDSQVNIAILYARGEGVPRDFVESYKWFAVAANDGDTDAAVKRDQVFNTLPEDRGAIAKEKVASWQAKQIDQDANNVLVPDSWNGEATNTASIDMKKAIMNIQAILNNNGFDAGKPDGIVGNKTVSAIKEFQTSIGMEPDGTISDQLVQELLKRNS